MAIIKTSRADSLHKLELQYRSVYKKDGVLFRVNSIRDRGPIVWNDYLPK